ncbi:hypothetical protein GALL_479490 [mine drainage metagenome]|uniref:Uncharacterized protein n=1 Tax=mine drainage metagenome TaxID=410659 RepID=A0A1J5Q3J0_9ZZZZ
MVVLDLINHGICNLENQIHGSAVTDLTPVRIADAVKYRKSNPQ